MPGIDGGLELVTSDGALAAKLLAWPALKRKAYRLDPAFAT